MLIRSALLAATIGLGASAALAGAPAGEKKAELCVFCHRVDNTHGAPVLDGLPAGYLVRQFEAYKSGKRFGPAMQTNLSPLSAQDLQDIADYFSSRRPTRASTKVTVDREAQELGAKTAKELGCAGCHGESYHGMKDVPRLAGQLRNYLSLHTARLQRDPSLHPQMSTKTIPQPDIEAMATYFGSLEP